MTEGEILADKYRVEKVLGVGGMGVVVAARHIELEERVAIKFLLPAMLADGVSVARFQREAKAAVRIKSEHVVRVFDVGRLQNGAPYMVMEYLEGSDLAGLLAQRGVLPVGQAVDFILQTCVAVADAHARGIIHRDLKPGNLFCVPRSDGQISIKVLDFGISKLTDTGSDMSFTQTSALMGSPLYMSPEQFRSSKNVDTRTDIWAIGAILFELVTGKAPFTAGSVPELAIRIATERAPSAAKVNPAVPPALAAVIATCLETSPDRRPRNVAELAVALQPFAGSATGTLVNRVVAIAGQTLSESSGPPARVSVPDSLQTLGEGEALPAAMAGNRTAPPIQWTSPGNPPRRSMLVTLGVVGGLLAGLGGAGAVWWTTQRAVPNVVESAASVVVAPPIETALPKTPVVSPIPVPPVATVEEVPVVAPSASADSRQQPQRPALRPVRQRAPKVERAPAAPAAEQPPVTKPQPAERGSCDPPFFFDAKGNRVFKQECL